MNDDVQATHEFQVRQATVFKIPDFDERAGEHCWLMVTGYRVYPLSWPPRERPKLDQENLVVVQGPGCYYCEALYSEHAARRRCKGKP